MFKFAVALLLCLNTLSAENEVWLGGGVRQDSLKWSIGIPETGPNVLSELEWKDVRMYQISLGAKGALCQDWSYRMKLDYGKIYDGKNTDSDYLGNDRTGLYLRSNSAADKGKAIDFSVAIGYPIYCLGEGMEVIPLMGYSRSEQHLHMRKGEIVSNTIGLNNGSFEGLNSRYETKWSTVWIGLDFSYEAFCNFYFYGTCEYHLAFYRASGHWNLRPEFDGPFHHNANANGGEFVLGTNYDVCNGLGLGMEVGYKYYRSEDGTDKTRVIRDSVVEIGTGRLNPVVWQSFYVEGILSYDF